MRAPGKATRSKLARSRAGRTPGPDAQLRSFISKFDAKDQKLIRSVRRALRTRLPTAYELVYDNYNFFVIGYSPTERPSDAIAARAGSVGLCFIQGAKLPDPSGILQGSGRQTRFIRLESAQALSRPEVETLIAALSPIRRRRCPPPTAARSSSARSQRSNDRVA